MEKDLLPVLLKFENHLKEPPVIHNIGKQRKEALKNALKNLHLSSTKSTIDVAKLPELQHQFAEGPSMTLTDILLFPCIYFMLVNTSVSYLIGTRENYAPTAQHFLKIVQFTLCR